MHARNDKDDSSRMKLQFKATQNQTVNSKICLISMICVNSNAHQCDKCVVHHTGMKQASCLFHFYLFIKIKTFLACIQLFLQKQVPLIFQVNLCYIQPHHLYIQLDTFFGIVRTSLFTVQMFFCTVWTTLFTVWTSFFNSLDLLFYSPDLLFYSLDLLIYSPDPLF